MNVKSVEKKEKTVEIKIEVTKEVWDSALNDVYKKYRNQFTIPGFRKGKAPRKVIENAYGAGIFYDDAIEATYKTALDEGMKEVVAGGTRIIANPTSLSVDDANADGYVFTAVCDLYPEVAIGEYKGIVAPYTAPEVSDEEIDAEIEKLRDRNSRMETVERPIEDGDTAVIDFEGFVDGVAFDGGKGENYNLKIGSGTFIPGFEDALIGHSAGEDVDVEVTFPEEYTPELAGKDAVFKCKIHEVKVKVLPELDDEFAKDVSEEASTVDELKEEQRKSLLESKETEAARVWENAVVLKAVESLEGDVPNSMYEMYTDNMLKDYEMQLQMQFQAAISLEQYLQYMGGNYDDFRASARTAAEGAAKQDLFFEKVAELESIEVSEEEITAELEQMAAQYGIEVEDIRKDVPADDLRYQLSLNKARALVIEAGVKGEPEAAEAEEAAE